MLIYCLLPEPPHFSLQSTFKALWLHANLYNLFVFVSGRESNTELLYSMQTHYYLSYASHYLVSWRCARLDVRMHLLHCRLGLHPPPPLLAWGGENLLHLS
jgi:hypothetical protein